MSDERPDLNSILNGNSDDLNALWDATEAAAEFQPLPPGKYRALLVDGRLAESAANKTLSYKLKYEVLEPAVHAGRKIFHDMFLTPNALPVSKRDLAKIGITDPRQLRQPPPAGIVVDLKIAQRKGQKGDDDTMFNRVSSFEVVSQGTPSDLLAPADSSPTAGPPDEVVVIAPEPDGAAVGPDGVAAAGPDGVAATAGPVPAESTTNLTEVDTRDAGQPVRKKRR
jgi:hypothetical protein